MKNILMMTVAVGALAFAAAPAMAQDGGVDLSIAGHMKGYVTWNDQDEAVGSEARSVDILRETEIHFTGETTLDNGLTVGFHTELEDDLGDGFATEESYAYFAGNWGRVNFGAEDGAAYLLQVAAPSADSNVDGIRQYISAFNADIAGVAAATEALDYDTAPTGASDKLTYITPNFNGFQAAVSYTPEVDAASRSLGVSADDEEGDLGTAYEAAVRYEGNFDAFRLAVGAGYAQVEVEEDAVAPANDDVQSWNLGANVGFGAFNIGAVYFDEENTGGVEDVNTDGFVVGVDYTTGPFVIGASYYNADDVHETAGLDAERYSGGVTYNYGPGMSFRGSVHHVQYDEAAGDDVDGTSLLLGTQINF
ncbi:porin [Micavibrio aeruginosavorus]|uniref:porin n=1 Tax=Micavibrio aeruginosavorus TaxID=349221 RepID=UPI003F4AA7A5